MQKVPSRVHITLLLRALGHTFLQLCLDGLSALCDLFQQETSRALEEMGTQLVR